MATVIIDENTPHDGTEFEAFDESRAGLVRKAAADSALASGSNPSVLTEVNPFRQGVEITTEAYRFQGVGPKIWAGNIKGYTLVRTIGQTPSFTEVQNDKAYTDQQVFNPVGYLEDDDYPLPIVLNDGPQQLLDTAIQVFVLAFWASNNVSVDSQGLTARGSVEDGNPDVTKLDGSNSRIKQFIAFGETGLVPFLDEGQAYYGPVETGITLEGFVNERTETFVPYDDRGNEKLIDKLNTSDNTLKTILRQTLNLDNDIRETHGIKSATAGNDVYGSGQAQYGTDSIAYVGFYRGS